MLKALYAAAVERAWMDGQVRFCEGAPSGPTAFTDISMCHSNLLLVRLIDDTVPASFVPPLSPHLLFATLLLL